jgi:CMP-N-acetylneuraminic acid synthetase
MKHIKDGYVHIYERSGARITGRQDLDTVYFPYGVIYLAKALNLIQTGTFYQDRTIPFLIERWQNYEVDDIYDFICIEAVINHVLEGVHK